jgi:hypothetical protein
MRETEGYEGGGPAGPKDQLNDQLVFVHCAYDLPGVYCAAWIDYYYTADLSRLRHDLIAHVDSQLELFSESADYGDYFCGADYGVSEGSLDDDEEAVFRSALDKENKSCQLDDLRPSEVLEGIRAIIKQRIQIGTLADIGQALALFKTTIDDGLSDVTHCDAYSWIAVQHPRQFARSFLEDLAVNKAFEPLAPLLKMLRRRVDDVTWPRSDVDLGQLLLVVDYYNDLNEDRGL